MDDHLLDRRLRAAGFDPASITPFTGGVVATAALVVLADGRRVFAKTIADPGADLFPFEAAGLRALADLGGVTTPAVVLSTPELLVLEAMQPRGKDESFWEDAGRMLARLHVTAIGDRFGWPSDGWLGRLPQLNGWADDGYEFFAERRILRWLSEPPLEAALDVNDRRALERLCAALPEIVPPQPPVLNHGDLWSENIVATAAGEPVFIDPAVCYTWAESDLSMTYAAVRPPESERFFHAYAEVAPLHDGWRERMPVLHLRELLSVIAHDDDDGGGALAGIRKVVAPFR